MREMAIEDLINLLWSSLQIKKGSHYFYERLEEEIGRRIKGVKDEQFETLIACFAGDKQQDFSDKFMKLIVSVLNEKRDKFELTTLVKVIWAFAKIDFNSDNYNTLKVLKDFAGYERLIANLPMMPQKSQVILLWTYTRDLRLLQDESCLNFLEKVVDGMLRY
jgi:hypothetical protein